MSDDSTALLDPALAADRLLNEPAPLPPTLTAAQLADYLGRVSDRCAGMLFTATATEDLDSLGVWARLQDLTVCGLWRQIVSTANRAGGRHRAFIGDEVALSTRLSQSRASTETDTALDACSLPGLVEAIEAGTWSHWHARVLLRELNNVPALSLEQRAAVVLILLARYHGQDPHRLGKDTARLIASIDPAAAAARQQAARARRRTQSWAEADGQAVLQLRGPNTDIAAALAALRAHADTLQHPDSPDERSTDARLFDAAIDLLTGGHPQGHWHIDLLVPYSLTQDNDLELADLPGLGPVLPGTARDLLSHADTLSRISIGPDGHVIATDPPHPLPTPAKEPAAPADATVDGAVDATAAAAVDLAASVPEPAAGPSRAGNGVPADILATIDRLIHAPIRPPEGVAGYAVPAKLKRFLQARDRTCTFPGCHRRVTDKDHGQPWPAGRTHPDNLGCLCRHHHQAKQVSFRLIRLPDGTVRWITRGNQAHDRPPEGY